MPNIQLLIICLSAILGISSVATIFINGWVKMANITELKTEIKELWAHISKVSVLETKLEAIDDKVSEIKDLLNK